MPAPTPLRPLELLERALAWTRTALAAVPGHPADAATPCAGWDLAQLLRHMHDGFDAFLEASGRPVSAPVPDDVRRAPELVARDLAALGRELLGSWTVADGGDRVVGNLTLPAGVLLQVAALEVAVHGWDLAQVCAPDLRLPPELAAALLPVAYRHVSPADRPRRFGPVVPVRRRDPVTLLLAQLGRTPADEVLDDVG